MVGGKADSVGAGSQLAVVPADDPGAVEAQLGRDIVISERRLIGARVCRPSALERGLQAENADESGHKDDRQERGRSDDVRVARDDPHTVPKTQEARRLFSARKSAFYTW